MKSKKQTALIQLCKTLEAAAKNVSPLPLLAPGKGFFFSLIRVLIKEPNWLPSANQAFLQKYQLI